MNSDTQPLPEVLFLGALPFPEGAAGSNILRGHCRAVERAGFSVGVLATQASGRAEDRQPDGGYAYRGIPYWPVLRAQAWPGVHRVLNSLLAWNDDRLAWLSNHGPLQGVRAVIAYCGTHRTVPMLVRLRAVCRRNGIRLFNNVVEWHEPGRFDQPRFALGTIDGELQRRWLNQRLDGIICISEFLQQYYASRGCPTLLLPPLLDLSDPIWSRGVAREGWLQTDEISLLFSGNYKRERHDIILRAVLEGRRRGAPVCLAYLGSSRGDIVAMPGVGEQLLREMGSAVRFHGRVPFDEMLRITSSASYGVLIRDDSRWSRACFPSKIPEFFALGVPVIGNLTSDLARYLHDGENAWIVPALSVEALSEVLVRVSQLETGRYERMRAAARVTARRFDGASFADEYRRFIEA